MRWTVVMLVLLAAPLIGQSDMLDDHQAVAGMTVPVTGTDGGRRIMLIGDSIQAGSGLKHATSQASWRLQGFGGVVVHNFASPGATMADIRDVGALTFIGMDHATTGVDLLSGYSGLYGLVINLGTNDWGHPEITLSSFVSAYGVFLDSIPRKIKVACMSPTWSTKEGMLNSHGNTMDDFRAATRAVCEVRGATYLEGKDAIPNDPAYFIEGVHPNDRGHKAMGSFLLHQLRALGWITSRPRARTLIAYPGPQAGQLGRQDLVSPEIK